MPASRKVANRPSSTDAGRRTPATRSDVARLAGVSSAVVSYVVNNGPRPVATATAARVREAMELLGYRPNASARALRKGTTDLLGLVVADALNPYFTEYTAELVRAAAAAGKRLLVGDSYHDERAEAEIVDDLISRQVDGLLFASTLARLDQYPELHTSGIPSVLIDCPGPVPGRRTVGTDVGGAAELLVGHLAGHGRRRIGLIIGEGGFGDPDPREQGWRRALRTADLPDGPIVRVPWTPEGGYAGAAVLLAADPELDAVFASNDQQAIGLLRALHEHGVQVPGDVAVVSFDGTKAAEFSWPPLTVARQPLEDLAKAAIQLLDEPVSAAGAHRSFQTELVRRGSCGCRTETVEPASADLVVRTPTRRIA